MQDGATNFNQQTRKSAGCCAISVVVVVVILYLCLCKNFEDCHHVCRVYLPSTPTS